MAFNFSNDEEIQTALEEFESKTDTLKKPQQQPVDNLFEAPKIVKLVIKLSGGAIKEQRQAEYILLLFVLIIFFISFYLFFSGLSLENSRDVITHPIIPTTTEV